jgi:hypothetical protein
MIDKRNAPPKRQGNNVTKGWRTLTALPKGQAADRGERRGSDPPSTILASNLSSVL